MVTNIINQSTGEAVEINGQTSIFLPYHDDIQGTWNFDLNISDDYTSKIGNYNSNSDSDETDFPLYLNAGGYILNVISAGGINSAILDVRVDGVLVFSTDQYWFSKYHNRVDTSTQFDIPTSGQHTIQFIVNGHNASSHGYQAEFYTAIFTRVA
jgi:hypothetical protein